MGRTKIKKRNPNASFLPKMNLSD